MVRYRIHLVFDWLSSEFEGFYLFLYAFSSVNVFAGFHTISKSFPFCAAYIDIIWSDMSPVVASHRLKCKVARCD